MRTPDLITRLLLIPVKAREIKSQGLATPELENEREGDISFWRHSTEGGYFIRNGFLEEFATLGGPIMVGGQSYFITMRHVVLGENQYSGELWEPRPRLFEPIRSENRRTFLRENWTFWRGNWRKFLRDLRLYFARRGTTLPAFPPIVACSAFLILSHLNGNLPKILPSSNFNDFALIGPLPIDFPLTEHGPNDFRGFVWDTSNFIHPDPPPASSNDPPAEIHTANRQRLYGDLSFHRVVIGDISGTSQQILMIEAVGPNPAIVVPWSALGKDSTGISRRISDTSASHV